MIYFDGIHIVADSLEELHKFAEQIGIKRCWFEGTKKGHPHYDAPNWAKGIVRANSRFVSKRGILMKSKEMLEKSRQK